MIPDLKWKLAVLVAPLLLAVQIGWQLDVMRESAYADRRFFHGRRFAQAHEWFTTGASTKYFADVPAYLLGCILIWCCLFGVFARPRLLRSLSLSQVLVCSWFMCLVSASVYLTAETIVRGALGGYVPILEDRGSLTTFERTEIALLVAAGCLVVIRLVQCLRKPTK